MRWRSLSEALYGALWYLIAAVVLPLIALTTAGLIYFWERGSLLLVLSLWLCAAIAAYAGVRAYRWIICRRRHNAAEPAPDWATRARAQPANDDTPDRLEERADWSARDRQIWDASCTTIEAWLEADIEWSALQAHALELLNNIAREYHRTGRGAQWRFTLPEGLLLMEEVSRRYRRVVAEHVPFADRVTIASMLAIYDRHDQITRSFKWANRVRRLLRLTNPLGALIGELRDQVTDRMFDTVNRATQVTLKRLLLQEVAQVGIDLYSGRLKVSDAELSSYRSNALIAAKDRAAAAIEPLQVLVLGQTNAGKSSLINGLLEHLGAESDLLPTTDAVTVHTLPAGEGMDIHLLDTPGIDSSGDNWALLSELAEQADLVVWVSSATQAARTPTQRLFARIEAAFASHPERRPPPMLLVVTHVDALSPKAEWSPPYDLCSQSPKARQIALALASVRDQIGMDEQVGAVPVCLAPHREAYNVDAVLASITTLTETAAQAQLNRRRVEQSRRPLPWRSRWRQMRKLGVALGNRWSKGR